MVHAQIERQPNVVLAGQQRGPRAGAHRGALRLQGLRAKLLPPIWKMAESIRLNWTLAAIQAGFLQRLAGAERQRDALQE